MTYDAKAKRYALRAYSEWTARRVAEDQMSQHTPGPWIVRETGHSTMPFGIDAKTGVDGYWLARVWREPDARLIAAAPKMLALIRDYFNAYKDHPERLGSGSSAAHRAFARARDLLAEIDG